MPPQLGSSSHDGLFKPQSDAVGAQVALLGSAAACFSRSSDVTFRYGQRSTPCLRHRPCMHACMHARMHARIHGYTQVSTCMHSLCVRACMYKHLEVCEAQTVLLRSNAREAHSIEPLQFIGTQQCIIDHRLSRTIRSAFSRPETVLRNAVGLIQ